MSLQKNMKNNFTIINTEKEKCFCTNIGNQWIYLESVNISVNNQWIISEYAELVCLYYLESLQMLLATQQT